MISTKAKALTKMIFQLHLQRVSRLHTQLELQRVRVITSWAPKEVIRVALSNPSSNGSVAILMIAEKIPHTTKEITLLIIIMAIDQFNYLNSIKLNGYRNYYKKH